MGQITTAQALRAQLMAPEPIQRVNAMHALELARRLEGTGVAVNCVHPGSIASGFGGDGDTRFLGKLISQVGRVFMASPEQGARTPVMLAASTSPRVAEVTGGYFSHGRQWRPSRAARDAEAARRLWEISEQLVGADADSSRR